MTATQSLIFLGSCGGGFLGGEVWNEGFFGTSRTGRTSRTSRREWRERYGRVRGGHEVGVGAAADGGGSCGEWRGVVAGGGIKKIENRLWADSQSFSVGVRRLELPTSTSRTWRAANCATPRLAFRVQIYKLFFILHCFFRFFYFLREREGFDLGAPFLLGGGIIARRRGFWGLEGLCEHGYGFFHLRQTSPSTNLLRFGGFSSLGCFSCFGELFLLWGQPPGDKLFADWGLVGGRGGLWGNRYGGRAIGSRER